MAEMESKGAGGAEGEAQTSADWQLALAYVKENPRQVAAGVVFLLFCIAAGGFYSLHSMARDREVTTEYAAALAEEDASIRASELKKIASGDTRWRAEALYLAGEAAIEAKSYDEARTAFNQVVSDFGSTDYAAPAAEGLAFLDENAGKLEEALAGYKRVFETYSDTYIGRRQPYNIARVHEALQQFPEAVEQYKLQSERFPGSTLAALSDQALARLESQHPDLFPKDEDEHNHDDHADAHGTEAAAQETAAPADAGGGSVEPTPAESSPAPEASEPPAAVETPGDQADSASPAEAEPAPESAPAAEAAPADSAVPPAESATSAAGNS